ncbi:MAG: hypothetical protein LUD17_01915 [Bacteroidales bacterium]|nr:hypothetical protein [Bacteroidales bacterium]
MDTTASTEQIFDATIDSLSARAKNCCRAIGITDIVSLIRYVEANDITSIKNCGKKTTLELERVIKDYRANRVAKLNKSLTSRKEKSEKAKNQEAYPYIYSVPKSFQPQTTEAFQMHADSAAPEVRAVFLKIYPTPSAFFNTVLGHPSQLFTFDKTVSYATMEGVWQLGKEILSAVSLLTKGGVEEKAYLERANATLREVTRQFDSRLNAMLYTYIPANLTPVIEKRFSEIVGQMSRRAINVLGREEINYANVLEFCQRLSVEACNISQCGRRTSEEIQKNFRNFRQYLLELAEANKEEAEAMSARTIFPFLTPGQLQMALLDRLKLNHYPYFLIAYFYFLNTEDRQASMYDAYQGITVERKNLRQIADTTRVTSERIRQILRDFITPADLRGTIDKITSKTYKELSGQVVHINAIVNAIAKEEFTPHGLKINLNAISGILGLRQGIEIVRFHDHYFAVPAQLGKAINWTDALASIDKHHRSRSAQTRRICLEDVIQEQMAPTHELYRDSLGVLSHMSRQLYGLKSDKEHMVTLPSNAIDFEHELYQILEEKGQPMGLEDLFKEFYRRNPDYSHKPRTSLKLHLFSSERIKPIGKTATYSLSHWDYNTLTIRELIAQILEESPVPLSSEEITKRLAEIGRPTNPNSVHATIGSDTKRSYQKFEGGLIGLADKEYPEEFSMRTGNPHAKKNFKERFKELLRYLDSRKHLPSSAGDNDEVALYRWYNNVQNSHISLQPHEREQYDRELAKRQRYLITSREYIFLLRCTHYKEFVEKYGEKPTQTSRPSLYLWYRGAQKSRVRLSDREAAAMADIATFLASRGLQP